MMLQSGSQGTNSIPSGPARELTRKTLWRWEDEGTLHSPIQVYLLADMPVSDSPRHESGACSCRTGIDNESEIVRYGETFSKDGD